MGKMSCWICWYGLGKAGFILSPSSADSACTSLAMFRHLWIHVLNYINNWTILVQSWCFSVQMRFQSLQRLCLRINSQKSIVVAEAQHILLWVQKTFQCTYHLLVESWGKVVGVWFGSSWAEQMCICLLQARQLSIIFRFSVTSSTSRDRRSGTCMANGTAR